MINIIDKSKCCGCGACACICPQNCITIDSDNEGFDYPSVDVDNCINCGACNKVCPYENINKIDVNKEIYIGWSEDEEILKNSSSGGMFATLANYFVENGGVVYGAGFDEKFNVCHKSAYSKSEIFDLQRSKYVQSRTNYIFKEIKKLVLNNDKVMFVGTPCQIRGLKNYLGELADRVLLVDFKCHGVPSPKLWEKYLKYIKEKTGGEDIEEVNFRNKDNGWHNYNLKIKFINNKVYNKNHYLDRYLVPFFDNRALRLSCYECNFDNSFSDITLADAWTVEKKHKELEEITKKDKGLSLIGVNTDKGKEIFKEVLKRDFVAFQSHNMELNNPHKIELPSGRDDFFAILKGDHNTLFNKYCKVAFKTRIYLFIRWILKCTGLIALARKIKK